MSTQPGSSVRMRCLVCSLTLVLTACEHATDPGSALAPPVALEAEGLPAPENVTSARVVVAATPGDSVRVLYWLNEQAVQSTPYYLVSSGRDTIDVLGVRAAATYDFQVEAQRNGKTSTSKAATFQTADLPPALAAAQMAHINGGSPARGGPANLPWPPGRARGRGVRHRGYNARVSRF